jgi:protein-S-isoprenylcysteine O-methyltransferase Ste14
MSLRPDDPALLAEAAGPGVKVPPPAIAGGAILAAWVMQRLLPVQLGPPLPEIGALVVFLALALIGWSILVLVRGGNDPRPDRPDVSLIEAGPFGYSRNPVYLGFLLVTLGMALRWGTLWGWVAVAATHLVLDRYVVRREEAYLGRRFGAAYDAYRGRVRRWV